MAALRGNSLIAIPLAEALSKNRTVTPEMIDVAEGILAPIESPVHAK
jgi:hypothetical protein